MLDAATIISTPCAQRHAHEQIAMHTAGELIAVGCRRYQRPDAGAAGMGGPVDGKGAGVVVGVSVVPAVPTPGPGLGMGAGPVSAGAPEVPPAAGALAAAPVLVPVAAPFGAAAASVGAAVVVVSVAVVLATAGEGDGDTAAMAREMHGDYSHHGRRGRRVTRTGIAAGVLVAAQTSQRLGHRKGWNTSSITGWFIQVSATAAMQVNLRGHCIH